MPYKANFLDKFLQSKILWYVFAVILTVSIWNIAYGFGQNDFFAIFPFYTLAFGAWLWLTKATLTEKHIYLISIFIRLGLLFAFPSLSDDIYRFFWDGKLTLSGISPYGILPTDALHQNIPYLDQELFEQLNSQSYYTIYPPISQLYYFLSAVSGDIVQANVVLKILFIITEVAGLFFLFKILKSLQLPIQLATIYMFNPLVILEGVGNLHFEVIMISFLCISIYYIFNNRIIYGAAWLALSISVKLLPLMLLPFFWFRWRSQQKWKFFIILFIFLSVLFSPMAEGIQVTTFMQSVDLYFRKFEFNASIYYVMRWLGYQISGYNLIQYLGPLLGLLTIGINVYQAAYTKTSGAKVFLQYALIVWTAYLLLATTVHPWYVISILFFAIFTSYRFAAIWSYLIFISYINYSYPVYYENLWWIAMEYTLLTAWMVWEYTTKPRNVI